MSPDDHEELQGCDTFGKKKQERVPRGTPAGPVRAGSALRPLTHRGHAALCLGTCLVRDVIRGGGEGGRW